MAGFQALRGMYRPLEARSVADFWNRVHVYFKELLVEFFFYPTFASWFRGRPGLRMFAATFAAACFGNFFYHFFCDLGTIERGGLLWALARMQTYALYCVLLALGIGLSQLRGRRASVRPASRYARISTIAVVLCFFGLLSILDDAGKESTLRGCGRFFLDLFPPVGTLRLRST
jgi:D-alanyl-lipoteichoic acid acyltransferase DltB (MBOAT superfamily)